jgi:nitroreductase
MRMEFEEVIRKRRMVRSFTDEAIPPDSLARIVRAAQRAPSAGFSQGVEFVIVTGRALRDALAGGEAGAERMRQRGMQPFAHQAPVHIAICVSPDIYKGRYREEDKGRLRAAIDDDVLWQVPYWHTDAGCAMMLILLAAVDEGLAAAFVGPADRQEEMKSILGIPPEWTLVGLALIGHEAPDARSYGDVGVSVAKKRRSAAEVIHRERW